jgi:hypothetical protein
MNARCAMRAMQNHPVALDPHHLPLPLPVRRVPAGFSSPADDYLDGRPAGTSARGRLTRQETRAKSDFERAHLAIAAKIHIRIIQTFY